MTSTTFRTLATAAVLAAVATTPVHAAKVTDPQPVRIANAGSDPVPVVVQAPAGEQHVQVSRSMTAPGGETNFARDLFEVPAGKALLVERVNGEAITAHGGQINAQVGTLGLTMTMPLTPMLGTAEGDLLRGAFNEELGLEVRGPGSLRGSIIRFGPQPDSDVTTVWTVIGKLVDCAHCVAAG